jgi:predicted ATPase/DNA-binding XRE family transcriptional regulator
MPVEDGSTFAMLLRGHRRAAGLSQEELAERAGLSVRGLSDLERGARRAPHVATVRRLADALRLGEVDRGGLLAAAARLPGQRSDGGWAPTVGQPQLPHALTSFVGRERQVAEIQQLLSRTRILTLTGTGGVGKTRLALELARGVANMYADGLWWVELAPLTDPQRVPRAVADRLRVPEQVGRPLRETLQAALVNRQLLLVLDNCEHVLSACAELIDALVGVCPRVTVLATSREPFRIAGETTWVVPPLIPPERLDASVEEMAATEAVRLFVQRAQAAVGTFTVTADNAPVIAAICSRLEGLPLAIELAAARVQVLTVQQIAERLDDCLRVLTTGARLAPLRHQTLRAALDWSYALLSEVERRTFERLGIFAGGWTLEAAEAICAEDGLGAEAILDLLASLVDKSLVIGEEQDARVRYRLLDPVRQYAREQLALRGGTALRRHAEVYLALAEAAAQAYHGPREQAAFEQIGREQDNLRAALRWLLLQGEADLARRVVGALWWFWMQRRDLAEARGWLESVAALAAPGPTWQGAQVWYLLASVAWLQGDYPSAQRAVDRSLATARAVDHAPLIGRALAVQAALASLRGEQAVARSLAEESLALARRHGDAWNAGRTLELLAELTLQEHDVARSRELLEECAALGRTTGDAWSLSMALIGLGDLARTGADYEQAGRFYEEALALQRSTGHSRHTTSLLHNLGYVALRGGETGRARLLFQESLAQFRDVGEQRGVAECLAGLAGVAAAEGHADDAARLFGAAEALFERLGTQLSPSNRADYERSLAEARAALDLPTFASLWAEGRLWPWEDALRSVAAG